MSAHVLADGTWLQTRNSKFRSHRGFKDVSVILGSDHLKFVQPSVTDDRKGGGVIMIDGRALLVIRHLAIGEGSCYHGINSAEDPIVLFLPECGSDF